ncbi:MAG TPA: SusC/RagA family TonB-linked outer membrane protein [Gemmatimonadales bacterium]|nr:SusC/RagA family TonB-linked outer membrane protein [Gemmatimonadales bacterium]
MRFIIRDQIIRQLGACAALAVGLLAGVPVAAAQGVGTIKGTVVSRDTRANVTGARVLLTGSNRSTLTDQEGRFRLSQIPAGSYEVFVATIGYGAASQKVTVPAGDSVTVDFTLAPVAVSLEAITVTGTGEQRLKELGNVVSQINADSLVQSSVLPDFASMLNSRTPSVQVIPSAGTSGTGARVRIRGLSSVSLSNEPIYYIDGVRTESGSNSLTVGTGGQSFSRINDINPDEIQDIDIVKGPSAATLYGTQAANGVVRITTRRGLAGRPRWNFYAEGGVLNDNNSYPINYFSWGRLRSNNNTVQCLLPASALPVGATGACVIDSLTSFNVLQDDSSSFFGTGYRGQVGLQVAGGTENVQYFVSGELENELGHYRMPASEYGRIAAERQVSELPYEQYRPNEVEKMSLRTNVNAQLGPKADVAANIGFVQSSARLPQNDNNVTGMLPSGLFGRGFAGTRTGFGGQWGFSLPGEVFAITVNQDITRFTGALNGNWRITPQIAAHATLGVDHTNRVDELTQLRDQGPAFSTFRRGRRQDNRFSINQYTVDLSGTGSYALTPVVQGRTTVGVQYLRDYFWGVRAQGLELTPGGETTGAGSIPSTSEETTESITLGAYIEQVVGWQDRRFFTAALRVDDNSAFGKDFAAVVYPKVQASWVIADEDFFPASLTGTNLRLRAAYGQSGRQPGSTDATRFLQPATASLAGTDQGGLIVGELGNATLKPERTTELEMGFDAGFLQGRGRFEFTYYNRLTKDALVNRPIPPSLGASANTFQNIGSVANKGIEGMVSYARELSNTFGFDVSLGGSWNANELKTLGEGVSPIILGRIRHVPGYPLFGYWDRPILGYNDRDGDGVIEFSTDTSLTEVMVGDTAVFLGYSIPRTQLLFNLGVTMFRNRLRVGGLLDYRGGFKQNNFTEYFRCTSSAANNCDAVNDPDASLDQQARAIAARTPQFGATAGGYIEDASFLKLRELSLLYSAPASWARAMRASTLSFAIAGRNLATWTDYKGIDPELNGNGQSDQPIDFLTQPPVTYWTLRVNVGF